MTFYREICVAKRIRERLLQYIYLMRLNKPIGIMLLLWPTLWALWLASEGTPDKTILLVFVGGVIVMRSLGCILNDYADRHFDGHVERTKNRPLASGKILPAEALLLAALLCVCALSLVLICNWLTLMLACIGVILVVVYPLMKRFTHVPQLGLGAAFSWGVPMAFAAQTGMISMSAWFLFLTGVIWPVAYDTIYAMIDRRDDIKIGVKSTAILFDDMDKLIIALLQALFVILLVIVGLMFHLHPVYYVSLMLAAGLFVYQQWLIKNRDSERCYEAFINNNWVGLIIFTGILMSYLS